MPLQVGNTKRFLSEKLYNRFTHSGPNCSCLLLNSGRKHHTPLLLPKYFINNDIFSMRGINRTLQSTKVVEIFIPDSAMNLTYFDMTSHPAEETTLFKLIQCIILPPWHHARWRLLAIISSMTIHTFTSMVCKLWLVRSPDSDFLVYF